MLFHFEPQFAKFVVYGGRERVHNEFPVLVIHSTMNLLHGYNKLWM